jgi:putative glycerol-1-phosphate prenyltransferase
LLFLSLLSGRNPEFLIEQHIKAIPKLRSSSLEIIPTAYILIDGGKETAVQRVSKTFPMKQDDMNGIVSTALAAQFSGKALIYLEAGSGAKTPVNPEIIKAVSEAINIPIIVGGGIRNAEGIDLAYKNGATMVVVGTAFENKSLVVGF